MPAVSKSQQQAAGIALSAKRGETKPSKLFGAAKEMYDSMSEKELEDFAGTKTKGLPDKIEEYATVDEYDIYFGIDSTGLTVYDHNRKNRRGNIKIAHIGNTGKITWLDKELTPKAKKFIEKKATEFKKRNASWTDKVKKEGTMKLKDAMNYEIKEDVFASITDPDSGLTEEQKSAFLGAVGEFNNYNKSIYREHNLKEITEAIVKIGKLADKYIMAEQDDWFDGISIKRDMKSLQESIKLFEVTAKDMGILQQRIESVYEEVGSKLGKYFDINDVLEEEK